MADARWMRLWEVFHEALEHEPQQRDAFLDRACEADAALRQRLADLLRAHASASLFIEPPTSAEAGRDVFGRDLQHPAAALAAAPPPRVARYRVLSLLGEGGFAHVYLAEQTEPVQRQVALKVLKAGMDSQRVLARFAAERQALALLDHPGIAKVFDAGMTDDGRPYFAMELIAGEPITRWCDAQRLSTRQRLQLFMQVCEAVQHAHHKGIIHRDLKPANILVVGGIKASSHQGIEGAGDAGSEQPREPLMPRSLDAVMPPVKIIDFGVAKAIAQPLAGRTLFTEAGLLVGTPEYMSPEQAGASAAATDDIDTRADVYALGVLLYEMLTSSLPFEPRELRAAALDQMQRVIREREPPRPSQRLSTMSERGGEAAAQRATDLRTLARQLSGDLDWIVMKALEKDRDRRYRTPSEFAADVERHLRDEPVLAGPPGAAYRMKKFVRRNRATVAAAALVFAALAGGVVATSWQAVRASSAEADARELAESEAALRALADDRAAEAQRQARIAQEVARFLNRDILAAADPRSAPRPDLTLREAVDAAAAKIGERFTDEPEVEASVRRVLGDVYRSLGLPREALPHIERARELFGASVPNDDPRLLATINDLALAYQALGRLDDAGRLYREGLEARKRMLGESHRETIIAGINLATLYVSSGRLRDAETLLRSSIAAMEHALAAQAAGEDQHQRGSTESRGDSAPIATVSRDELIIARQHLARVLQDSGRWSEVEPLAREALEHHRAQRGEDHPYTIAAMGALAAVCDRLQRDAEAEQLFRRIVEACRRRLGEEHAETALAMSLLAKFLARRAGGPLDFDEALALQQRAVAIARGAVGETHATTIAMTNGLASIYDLQQRWADAEPLYASVVSASRGALPADHWLIGLYLLNHAKCLNRLERWADAEPPLVEGQRILLAALGESHEHSIESRTALAYLYSKTGRMEQAREQQRLRDAARGEVIDD